MAERSDAPLLNDSLASEWDFSALGDPEASEAPPPEPEPESSDVKPETNVCPTCGDNIVRLPGMRGRLPKYHPSCKPSATRRASDSLGISVRKGGNAKAEREASEVIVMVKKQLIQGAIALSIVDKYSGFVIMSMTPRLCENLHGVLVRYDSFRRDALAMKSGGSVFGLVLAVLMMLIPIAAHHGLIPGAKLRQLLENMPVTMFKLAQRMKEGEEALSQMMDRVANEMLRPKHDAAATQDGGGAAPTP